MRTRSDRSDLHIKKRNRRLVFTIIGAVLLVLILGVGGYMYYAYNAVKDTAKTMHIEVKSTDGGSQASVTRDPINILLLGVDKRPNDPGRSDTIIVATLNPKTKSMLLTSIPRDTRALIVGTGTTQKINAAYPIGGVEMTVNTVEHLLNIKLDYVGEINMQGMKALVDAVGGVTVDNPIDWYDEGYYKKGYHYTKGVIHLDGAQAVGYVRMRHLDPQGDFGRNLRQRLVIQAILKKAAGPSLITNLNSILNAVGTNIKTDATFAEMKTMAESYRQCRDQIYTHELHGVPQRINNLDYVVVSDQEKTKVHQMIDDEKNGTFDPTQYDGSSVTSKRSN